MGRLFAAVLLFGGCYGPSVATGVPCTAQRECPGGQVCAANNRCELPGQDGGIDVGTDVPPDAFALTGWSPPRPLASLNTTSVETDPSITADGLDIVFASDRAGGLGGTDLYRAHRNAIDDDFGPPILITEISTAAADQAAELSGDGLTIYLKRIGTAMDDVFVAHRMTRTSAFDTPTQEIQLSSAEADTNPAISRNGLVFSTTRGLGDAREMYIYERANQNKPWSSARQLTELSTPKVDSGAAFDTSGLVIVFHSDRNAAVTDMNDLFVAVRSDPKGMFGPAMPLTELNTDVNESDASITADLRFIVYECAEDLCFSTR